jgi:hypothetical protein
LLSKDNDVLSLDNAALSEDNEAKSLDSGVLSKDSGEETLLFAIKCRLLVRNRAICDGGGGGGQEPCQVRQIQKDFSDFLRIRRFSGLYPAWIYSTTQPERCQVVRIRHPCRILTRPDAFT